jgi:hypothetical protein
MAERSVFKKWRFVCLGETAHRFEKMKWNYEPMPTCETCGANTEFDYGRRGDAPSVHGDEIDIWIKHGLVNEDGSPKHFTSKAEIRAEAARRGLVIAGETPKMTPEYADRRAAEDAKFGFTYKR